MTLLEHKVPDWFPASMVALGVNFQRSAIMLENGLVENGPAQLVIGFAEHGAPIELTVDAQITKKGMECPEGLVDNLYSFAYACFKRNLNNNGEVPS